MAYGTVIRMCGKLNMNPIDFTSLERDTTVSEQLLENRVMQYYVRLNQDGRDKVLGIMEDYSEIENMFLGYQKNYQKMQKHFFQKQLRYFLNVY